VPGRQGREAKGKAFQVLAGGDNEETDSDESIGESVDDESESLESAATSSDEDTDDCDDDEFPILPVFPRPRTNAKVAHDSQVLGKDQSTEWTTNFPRAGRVRDVNIVRHNGGVTPYLLNRVDNVKDVFFELLGKDNIESMIKFTNAHMMLKPSKGTKLLGFSEFVAFLGLMIARGVYKARREPRRSLWSPNDGRPMFAATMGLNRFEDILKHIRFDDQSSRVRRKMVDKFCPIRDLWTSIMENCQKCFRPFTSVTIDEQLMGCKSRCPFTQYMQSKPDKFGIKNWFICCSETSYVLSGFPYLGKDDTRDARVPLGEHVVMTLMEPYYGLGLNVTTDNFFTSLSCIKKLKEKKSTMVGTVRLNKREIPPSFVECKQMQLYESKFAFHEESQTLLVSYKAKRNKLVVLMSSQHSVPAIDEGNAKKKPHVVLVYNKTKGGVDTADQMLKYYTTRTATLRWSLNVFGNLLDIVCLNAFIICSQAKIFTGSRREFLIELSKALCQPHMETRNQVPTLQIHIKEKIQMLVNDNKNVLEIPGTRRLCVKCKKNKTTQVCLCCQAPVCGTCSSLVCCTCVDA
jgi:hypothetical protein